MLPEAIHTGWTSRATLSVLAWIESGLMTTLSPLLILTCGLSFSGKSTLALELRSRLDADVLSLDVINAERGLYGGQGISARNGRKLIRSPRHAL